MPYKLKTTKAGKFCVVNAQTGAEVNCHADKKKALRQLRAISTNEKSDLASADYRYSCYEEDCERAFFEFDSMITHAELVHEEAKQFSTEKREKLAKKGKAIPGNGGGAFPIENVQDLKNAIKAYGRAGNKAAAKAHIIRRAKALKATNLLPKGWNAGDSAAFVECPEHPDRNFSVDQFLDHAEAVHTFDDIQRLVSEAVREKYYRRGNYETAPIVPSVWAWVQDLSEDWVVFTVESDGDTTLYKSAYSITDGAVTLGEPGEVKRRTIYEAVKKKED